MLNMPDSDKELRHAAGRTGVIGAVLTFGLTLSFALTGAAARADEYRLQPGDVLDLYVAGRADIRESMPVNIDGNLVVPLGGVVPAAGRSLADVSGEIKQRVSTTALPAIGDGGLTAAEHIHPSLVSVSLRGYRPVYVDGTVHEAGAHDFIPGLTARQAIALAGGTSQRDRTLDPEAQLIELSSRLADLRARRAASQAKVERLRAEMTGTVEAIAAYVGAEDAAGDRAEDGGPDDTAGLQRRGAGLRQRQRSEDIAYFDAAIETAAREIESLSRQLDAETTGVNSDTEEFDRLAAAEKAGTVTAARLNESRRSLLFAQSGRWETQARLANVERDQQNLRNMRAQRMMKDQEEASAALSDELVTLATLDAELSGAEQRIAYVSQSLVAEGPLAVVTIRVARADGEQIEVAEGEDPRLLPGDLVTVSIERISGTDGARPHE